MWNQFDKENPSEALQDNHYYLVTHVYYATPMKAKWHDGCDAHWEVFIGNGKPNEIIYCWDNPCDIIAWRNMPDVFRA